MKNDKRFYWLKLKRDFFKRHDIQIIESMPNGKDYILFYLKLLCESVDHDGNLRFSNEIPYNEEMLSVITHTNIDIVRSAINVFSKLNMMEILDDGTFYMNEVNKMIGCETEWAEKKRLYREKKKEELGQCPQSVLPMSDKSKSIEIEKDIDIKKENIKEKKDIDIKISDIFNYWNTKNIIKHSKLTDDRIKAIQNKLKENSIEEIKEAIDHYELILHDKNYYWDYTWSIEDFLNRKNGFKTFLKEGSNWVNYQKGNKKEISRESSYEELKDKNYL